MSSTVRDVPPPLPPRPRRPRGTTNDLDQDRQSSVARSAVPRWARAELLRRRIADAVAVLIAVSVVPLIALVAPGIIAPIDPERAIVAAALAVIWFAALRFGPASEVHLIGADPGELRRATGATIVVFGVLAVLGLLIGLPAARAHVALSLPVGLLLLLCSRGVLRRRLKSEQARGRLRTRALLVGSRRDVLAVRDQLSRHGSSFEVAGTLVDDELEAVALPEVADSLPRFLGITSVLDAVSISNAEKVLVVTAPSDGGEFLRELGWRLESTSAELILATPLSHLAGTRVRLTPMDGLSILHVSTPVFQGGTRLAKRAMDIVVAGTALLFLLPLFGVLAAMVKIDSRGPVFFRQSRVGRRGTPFTMIKFRSMVVDAEAALAAIAEANEGAGPLFKLKRDPRVTRVGAWIRRYSLDELPQLINVLRGEMSLVGPRPPLASEVAQYESHVHRRLYVTPGLTGAWQVSGRSNLSWDESVRIDLFYVENWSFLRDLVILLRTVRVVLRPEGAY